jgi:hypothetical protein
MTKLRTLTPTHPTDGLVDVKNSSEIESFRARFRTFAMPRASIYLRQQMVQGQERSFIQVFPQGTSIVVNLDTFEFVSAETGVGALRSFVEKFGSEAPGWAFDVDRPMVLGGIAWPR